MVLSDAAQATCYQTSPRPTFHGAAASYSADGAYLSGIAGASVIDNLYALPRNHA